MIYALLRQTEGGAVLYIEYFRSALAAQLAASNAERFYSRHGVTMRHCVVPMLRWI